VADNGKRPDFIALYDAEGVQSQAPDPAWIIVEMESSIKYAKDVLRQLEAGIRKVRTDKRFKLRRNPKGLEVLALHAGECSTSQADIIRQGIKVGKERIRARCFAAGGAGMRLTDNTSRISFVRRTK
jgi:hypothetical protein